MRTGNKTGFSRGGHDTFNKVDAVSKELGIDRVRG